MNPYKVLGVDQDASIDVCKKAYRRLSRKYHPDNGGDSNLFHDVQQAWKSIEDGTAKTMIQTYTIKRTGLRHKTLFTFV